jgi:hypothetical protein
MKENIEALIKSTRVVINDKRINECIIYLKSLSDVEFRNIYINMPNSLENYQINADDADDSVEPNYYYYDYYDCAYAYVSGVDLIRRCYAISTVPLVCSIKILCNYSHTADSRYIRLDLESCKLLYEGGGDLCCLYIIANQLCSYESISFIIDKMRPIDFYNLFVDRALNLTFFSINNVLLLNKIHDKFILDHICDLFVMKQIDYNNIAQYRKMDMILISMILQCFYSINHMTYTECISFMTKQNAVCNKLIQSVTHQPSKTLVVNRQILFNNLLEFHINKPRGSHTKCAVTF